MKEICGRQVPLFLLVPSFMNILSMRSSQKIVFFLWPGIKVLEKWVTLVLSSRKIAWTATLLKLLKVEGQSPNAGKLHATRQWRRRALKWPLSNPVWPALPANMADWKSIHLQSKTYSRSCRCAFAGASFWPLTKKLQLKPFLLLC